MKWFENLKQWLQINDTIKIDLSKPSRPCYSTNQIKEFETIVKVKSKHFIEYSQIEKNFDQISSELEYANSLVAFYLMIEDQNPESFIKPYLDSLPTSTEEFELVNSDLKLIKGLINGNKYFDYLESLESDAFVLYRFNTKYQYIKELCFESFYPKYIHFRYLVGSRIFGYERDGKSQSALIPYIDLFNHSFEPNSTWDYDDSSDCFVLTALKQINPGEEIVDNYGTQTNFEFFTYYGFVCDSNPNISFELQGEEVDLKNPNRFTCHDNIKTISKKYLESHSIIIKKISNSNITQLYLDEIKLLKQIV